MPSISRVAASLRSDLRLEALVAIVRRGSIRLTDLARRVELPKGHILHELDILVRCGLVASEKRGPCRLFSPGQNLLASPTPIGGLVLRCGTELGCAICVELTPAALARMERGLAQATSNGSPASNGSMAHATARARRDRAR